MDLKSKIILIAGPTASGKSEFAIKIAKKINGEIINADSMQVYKQLKILTARPTQKNQKKIKHHLYGFQNVEKKFSTGAWLKLAIKKIKEIQKKNKVPILVGGTGLYFKVLTDGLVKIPNIPLKIRNETRSMQKKIGQESFYRKLIKLDPLASNKIDPNDAHRSIRAYEIKKYTKISMYKWFKKTKQFFNKDIFLKFYIDFSRDKLIRRINSRVEKMIKNGAVKEVQRFNKLKIINENSVNKVIGIHEISKYLNGQIDLLETKKQIIIKTRQYAKRQTTWARGQMMNWQKIEPQNLTSAIKIFK
tara:strand:+ start:185 stop:1096 length:912 start_codon:yes stop_codon:yes gene_type:complete